MSTLEDVFIHDITDAVTNMLWVEVYDCESYELAREVLLALREGGFTNDPTGQIAINRRVHDILIDALLPEGIAGNLDFGITARTILDHALFCGLNMLALKNSLEAWNMAHKFAPFD